MTFSPVLVEGEKGIEKVFKKKPRSVFVEAPEKPEADAKDASEIKTFDSMTVNEVVICENSTVKNVGVIRMTKEDKKKANDELEKKREAGEFKPKDKDPEPTEYWTVNFKSANKTEFKPIDTYTAKWDKKGEEFHVSVFGVDEDAGPVPAEIDTKITEDVANAMLSKQAYATDATTFKYTRTGPVDEKYSVTLQKVDSTQNKTTLAQDSKTDFEKNNVISIESVGVENKAEIAVELDRFLGSLKTTWTLKSPIVPQGVTPDAYLKLFTDNGNKMTLQHTSEKEPAAAGGDGPLKTKEVTLKIVPKDSPEAAVEVDDTVPTAKTMIVKHKKAFNEAKAAINAAVEKKAEELHGFDLKLEFPNDADGNKVTEYSDTKSTNITVKGAALDKTYKVVKSFSKDMITVASDDKTITLTVYHPVKEIKKPNSQEIESVKITARNGNKNSFNDFHTLIKAEIEKQAADTEVVTVVNYAFGKFEWLLLCVDKL